MFNDFENDDDMDALEAILTDHPELVNTTEMLPPNTTDEVPEKYNGKD